MPIKQGYFVKDAASGASINVISHELGASPKFIILFTAAKEDPAGFAAPAVVGIGFTDENMDSLSIGASMADNAGTSDAERTADVSALTFGKAGNVEVPAITAWNADTFTVSWPGGSGAGDWIVGWTACAGPTVRAQIIDYAVPGTGSRTITGCAFTPTLALFASGGTVGALPNVDIHAAFALGAADGTNQWTLGFESDDNEAAADSRRSQRTDNCIMSITTSNAYGLLASFSAFTSDGCTLSVGTATAADRRVAVLFLAGMEAEIGSFSKPTGSAPVTHSETGMSFNPQAVLLASFQDTATTSVIDEARIGFGISDGTTEVSVGLTDDDGANPTVTTAFTSVTKTYQKVNNDTETVDAEADVSLTAGGFDATFTTNDGVATQVLYLALRGGPDQLGAGSYAFIM